MNADDQNFMMAASDIARRSRDNGNHPFGAVLVDAAGRILIEAEMPGILIETGFISNAEESARLRTIAYHKVLAKGIADGIHDFFTSSKTAAYRK